MEERIRAALNLPGKPLNAYTPLSLAFVGDAFYTLVIRTSLTAARDLTPKRLAGEDSLLARAVTQAQLMKTLLPLLTEEEAEFYRRGKNASPHTRAKNASLSEYLAATGFETLLGMLYVTGQTDRALALIRTGWAALSEEDPHEDR